jgi:hypothetical protein
MSQIRSEVVFLGQSYDHPARFRGFEAKWAGVLRTIRTSYRIVHADTVTVEDIAQDAYKVFNAPEECLSSNQLRRLGKYRGPSLSVGDIVQVWRDGVLHAEALCCPIGWDIRYTAVTVE